jgi:ABC-type transport system involved in cytochrome bd biosynthesis fused ATPase/permease subunit
MAALVRLGFGKDTPTSFLDRTMATLSAGQAQRVALARAFASKRPLLLLDEPDANLDERSVECLALRLRELRGERSIAVAAHHPKLLACADDLVVLGGGT